MWAENEVGELMVVRLWAFKQMNAGGLCLALFAAVAFASYKDHQDFQMQTVGDGRRMGVYRMLIVLLVALMVNGRVPLIKFLRRSRLFLQAQPDPAAGPIWDGEFRS